MSQPGAGDMLNVAALEPLFEPWEEPRAYREKNLEAGQPAIIVKHRRPSRVAIAQELRTQVKQWRESPLPYAGASDTTRQLLAHWFERPHRGQTPAGDEFEFRYYFCQREAIETLVYLKEVRGIGYLSRLIDEFGGPHAQIAALGVTEAEDAWSRYAFKLAPGAGKTKVMSLAIAWSYFHALRESDSPMAKHFVVIAPNLTVYERLREDFGDGRIFEGDNADPLIPAEWLGDWNMSIVLQDEASGAATGGTLYLTNIHRLYDNTHSRSKSSETYDFMGPAVSRASALDTGAALRERITSHQRVMVLNDEAHHLWDPDSAWNEAIQHLHETIKGRTGGGLVAQLDFSATPKDNKGQLFKHIVCESPLGEAVDGGIVKTPVIGRADQTLSEEPSDNAAYRYDRHLRLGYERWKKSRAEWEKSGKKALMFVMCEDTNAADQIAQRLNTDTAFQELNDRTLNLHTNLKGKVKKIGKGPKAQLEFVPSDKEITEEDLRALRKLSRELDQNTTHYACIVSVLMLREGWDVRNVTTIVPLRPYSSKAAILPEQTLGRGLRRMTPPGTQGANELLAVVEHPAFVSLYKDEQEGLLIPDTDIDSVPATTVSIFPDELKKDLASLEIAVPSISQAYRIIPKLEGLTIDDARKAFAKYRPLPLGREAKTDIDYEGKHLFTGEVVERMKLHLPLLESGVGAVSYYVQQLEQICKVRSLHATLAPLMQTFLEEILFDEKTTLFDQRLIVRLGNSDVAEHVRAVFVPLIRSRTTSIEERLPASEPALLSRWKPYQVTHSERRPALEANRTLFNLVPCNRELEVAFTKFADRASDAAAFAKNAGPQCLRIDYLGSSGNLAFYTPDFFVRTADGHNYLVETKGREDRDVPRKARAAISWCEAASTEACRWEYLYVPQGVFERSHGATLREIADTCRPALQNLISSEESDAQLSLFSMLAEADERQTEVVPIVSQATLDALPTRYQKAIEHATLLFRFMVKKEGMNFASVFTGLLGSLDEAAKGLILRRLEQDLPADVPSQKAWFDVYLPHQLDAGKQRHYDSIAQNLKRTLVFNSGIMPLGLLRNCLDYALNDSTKLGGVFEAVKARFKVQGARDVLSLVQRVYEFRNTYVAHQEKELTDANLAQEELTRWIQALQTITEV